MPAKSKSENVVSLSCLLQIFTYNIDYCKYRGKPIYRRSLIWVSTLFVGEACCDLRYTFFIMFLGGGIVHLFLVDARNPVENVVF